MLKQRIESIDMLRGLVMVIMALDHVRDYFHFASFYFDPTDLQQTTVPIFLTRWVTHFCAPVFVMLAGTSAYMIGQKMTTGALSVWLLKRGLWLIVAEITIINFAWYFRFNLEFLEFAVIFTLGACMIILALLIHVPKRFLLVMAILMVAGHNLFDFYKPVPDDFWSITWWLMHLYGPMSIGSFTLINLFPLLPWMGLMILGYLAGQLYAPTFDAIKRVKILYFSGALLIVLFFVFRITNVYGDLYPWTTQRSLTYTVLSVLNVTKYPPSFVYTCITIGPSLIFLAVAESVGKSNLLSPLIVIGRVPMFYYIIHLYVIHLLACLAAVATGFKLSDMILETWVANTPELRGYGFNLRAVYVIWIGIVLVIYPLCKWYSAYKQANRDKWWLSYL